MNAATLSKSIATLILVGIVAIAVVLYMTGCESITATVTKDTPLGRATITTDGQNTTIGLAK